MAARKTKGTKDIPWSDKTRERIKSSMLINSLENHVLNNTEMKPTQVTAALGLLKKVVPDLSCVDQTLDDKRSSIISDKPLTTEEWEAKYSNGSHMESTNGSTTSTH